MKKLMVVAMVAFAAIAANAAKITWGVNAGTAITGLTDGTKYLVWAESLDTSKFSGQSSFDASTITAAGGTIVASSGYSSSSLNEITKVVPNSPVTGMTQGPHKFYSMVIAEDGKTLAYSGVATVPILNNEQAVGISQAGSTFTTVAVVPEPTSAMLLLLGVAGLALKRRRA